ncbi:MAG TPA: hypothetical protein VII95_05030, partial [Terriglobales bacterium]
MLSLFFIICGASVVFFVVFLVECWRPRRRPGTSPNVRRVPQSDAGNATVGRRVFVELEKQMAEFLLRNKSAAILLVVLAIFSGSLVAQEQEIPSPGSDAQ